MERSTAPAVAIPPTAFVAIGAAIGKAAIELGPLARKLDGDSDFSTFLRLALTIRGLEALILVALLAAAIDVMRSSTGIAAVGGRIAAVGFAVQLALHVILPFLSNIEKLRPSESFIDALPYASFAAHAAGLVGLALAARVHRELLVAAAAVVAVVTDPPGKLGAWLYADALGLDVDALQRLQQILALAMKLASFLLVIAVRMPPLTTNAPRAQLGMNLAAGSMWMRIIAVTSVTAFMLLLVGAQAKEGVGVLKFATIAAATTNVASLAMLGVALFAVARSSLHEMPVIPMVLAGSLVLWVAGVASIQLPVIINALYFDDVFTRPDEITRSLSIIGPIVAIAGIAIAMGALVSYGARRGFNELATRATSACAAYVALGGANLGIQEWLVPTAKSSTELALYSAMAIVCGFAGLVMVAKTFGLAALDVANEPSPPPRAVAR